MGILSWIIFGLIAGIIAKWIMPGKDGGGFIITVVLGIIGAVVAVGSVRCLVLVALTVSTSAALLWRWSVPSWCCGSTAKSEAKSRLI